MTSRRADERGFESNAVLPGEQERGVWTPAFSLGEGQVLDFDESIRRVELARRFGIDPSLEPIRALLEELGRPDATFRSVQVAGTNGKTSTSRYTAALLATTGLKCGLYTSPHLVSYVERVEVGGAPVSEQTFAIGISWSLAAWDRLLERNDPVAANGCTEFELLTAAACVMYALEGVDLVVFEVGLGGRWDATSAVETCGCAVTGIGLDHMGILGDTLELIAREKAAVIRCGNPCVLGTNAIRPQGVLEVMLERCKSQALVPTLVVDEADQPESLPADIPQTVFTHRRERRSGLGSTAADCDGSYANADARGASTDEGRRARDIDLAELVVDVRVNAVIPRPASDFGFDPDSEACVLCGMCGMLVSCSYEGIRVLEPSYQAQNIACALALATAVNGAPLDEEAVRAALASCHVPGRFEVVSENPLVLIDACHNPQSAEAFASAVSEAMPDCASRPTLLFGALADKDHAGIAQVVSPLFEDIVITKSDSERALAAEELACDVEAVTGIRPRVTGSLTEALGLLKGEPFVCCGTITLIGELLASLKAEVS